MILMQSYRDAGLDFGEGIMRPHGVVTELSSSDSLSSSLEQFDKKFAKEGIELVCNARLERTGNNQWRITGDGYKRKP